MGAAFCAGAAENRLRHTGQLCQAGGKVHIRLKGTGPADRGAEQTTTTAVTVNAETAIKGDRPVRADIGTAAATACAETHPQTAGCFNPHVIPAADGKG